MLFLNDIFSKVFEKKSFQSQHMIQNHEIKFQHEFMRLKSANYER